MASESEHSGLITPCTANDFKKNLYGMVKGHPCKIMEVAHSKTGKHGHAKVSLTGICCLTGKKYQDVQPAHAQMHFANVEKKVFQLLHIDVDNNIAQLMDENNKEYEIPLEGEEGEKLAKEYNPDDADSDYQVTVLSAPETVTGDVVRKEMIIGFKKVKADDA